MLIDVQQRPPQYCKAIILQLNRERERERHYDDSSPTLQMRKVVRLRDVMGFARFSSERISALG